MGKETRDVCRSSARLIAIVVGAVAAGRDAHAVRVLPPDYQVWLCESVDLIVVGRAVGLRDLVVQPSSPAPEAIAADRGMELGVETVTIVTLSVEGVVHGVAVPKVEFLYSKNSSESPRIREGDRLLALLVIPTGAPLTIDASAIDLEHWTFGPIVSDVRVMDGKTRLVEEPLMRERWQSHCAGGPTAPFDATELLNPGMFGGCTTAPGPSMTWGVTLYVVMRRRRIVVDVEPSPMGGSGR